MSDPAAFWIAALVCLGVGIAWWIVVVLSLLGLACAIAEAHG